MTLLCSSSTSQTRSLQEREIELRSQIKILDKEGAAHKREIKARDNAIEEKEKVSHLKQSLCVLIQLFVLNFVRAHLCFAILKVPNFSHNNVQ
jgi:hypothetical protein